MDALRALLDEIGWSTHSSDRQVDLTIHGAALIDALQDQLSVHANMVRDITQDDERREAIARQRFRSSVQSARRGPISGT
jgi:hypothetical protein